MPTWQREPQRLFSRARAATQPSGAKPLAMGRIWTLPPHGTGWRRPRRRSKAIPNGDEDIAAPNPFHKGAVSRCAPCDGGDACSGAGPGRCSPESLRSIRCSRAFVLGDPGFSAWKSTRNGTTAGARAEATQKTPSACGAGGRGVAGNVGTLWLSRKPGSRRCCASASRASTRGASHRSSRSGASRRP
jgi:hypothetical protein